MQKDLVASVADGNEKGEGGWWDDQNPKQKKREGKDERKVFLVASWEEKQLNPPPNASAAKLCNTLIEGTIYTFHQDLLKLPVGCNHLS